MNAKAYYNFNKDNWKTKTKKHKLKTEMRGDMNNISVEEARGVREEISSFIKALDKDCIVHEENGEVYKIYETMACYYLWLIKKESAKVSIMDIVSKIEAKKSNQYALMLFDDFNGLFLEYDSTADILADPRNGWIERSEEWSHFKALGEKYTEEQLAAAVYKTQFIEEDFYNKRFAVVPFTIGKLVDELLEIERSDSIVQLEASSYVLEALERNPDLYIEAYDEWDYTLLTILSIISDVMGHENLVCRSGLSDEGIKYDKVFVNNMLEPSEGSLSSDVSYDLENKWSEFPRDVSEKWNMCGEGILLTKDNGKAVAIMNAGELTLNKYRDVREFLCNGGFIEGVILLPDKMYANTWINPYLVIFSRNNTKVKFLDVRNDYVTNRKKGKRVNSLDDDIIESIMEKYKAGKGCIEVEVGEIAKDDYVLTPNRYVEVNDVNANRIKLGEVVDEIKRGITMSASEMDQTIMDIPSDIRCVLPSDIIAGVVTSEKYFHGKLRKPGKNEAHQGDILISKTGNPFRIAVADRNYLVVGNTYILDIDRSQYSPEYIKCYLSSKAGQMEIMKYASGSTTPIISVANLRNIEIPLYDEATQKELDQHANEIVNSLNEGYRQIRICEEEMDALFQ